MPRPRPEDYAPGTLADWEHLPVAFEQDRDEQDEYSHQPGKWQIRELKPGNICVKWRPF